MITALLVALSFNYPQAVKNVHWLGRESVCMVKHFRPCKRNP